MWVEFDCHDTIFCSTVTNLSENGMLLRTQELYFPLSTQFEVFIHLRDEILEVPVRVARLIKSEDAYNGIGIELIDPPEKYLEFIKGPRRSA